jgi:hypothetical protein
MFSGKDAFFSYIHLHLDRLCAIVLDGAMRELLIFVLVTTSACIYFRATVEITHAVLDEMHEMRV